MTMPLSHVICCSRSPEPMSENKLILSPEQADFLASDAPLRYMHGLSGSGKTTAAICYLDRLLRSTNASENILILTPHYQGSKVYRQYTDAMPYSGPQRVNIYSYVGLARRMLDLFWPVVMTSGLFPEPQADPKFLTTDNAIFQMDRIVKPKVAEGYFRGITMDYSLMLSQLIDNINKSALVGIPLPDIFPRLATASANSDDLAGIYEQAQECAMEFRALCRKECWLDYSLAIELFSSYLQQDETFHNYFFSSFRHLIVENIEEETPVMHDVLESWLPNFETALIISDDFAGHRYFMGADPLSARRFVSLGTEFAFFTPQTASSELVVFQDKLVQAILDKTVSRDSALPVHAFTMLEHANMIDQIDEIVYRCNALRAVQPEAKISLLSPYVSDILSELCAARFEAGGLKLNIFRPSAGLLDNSVVRAIADLLCLAHPEWDAAITSRQLLTCLVSLIPSLDVMRAGLIVDTILRRPAVSPLPLTSSLPDDLQDRIGSENCRLVDVLLSAINACREKPESLDATLIRLFDETLSREDFVFRSSPELAGLVSKLLSAYQQHIRVYRQGNDTSASKDYEFINFLQLGNMAAYYGEDDPDLSEQTVSLSPVTTYLFSNNTSDYQFWLDIGSSGWWERIYQPLTHPYVLSRNWRPGEVWKDSDEYAANQEKLAKIVSGLILRCRQHVFLCSTDFNELGEQQRGPLLRAISKLMRQQAGVHGV